MHEFVVMAVGAAAMAATMTFRMTSKMFLFFMAFNSFIFIVEP